MRRFLIIFVSSLSLMSMRASEAQILPPEGGPADQSIYITQREYKDTLYGDPGWIRKFQRRRELRTKITAGQTTLAALSADHFYMPVILANFPDLTNKFSVPEFQDHLFDNNPTGSMVDYFNEVSRNQFHLHGTVFGWFTLDQPKSYYADKSFGKRGPYPNNVYGFFNDAIKKADPSVDFSQFDNDGPDGVPNSGDDDGYVDGVTVIAAGVDARLDNRDSSNLSTCAIYASPEFITNDISANGGNIIVRTGQICSEAERFGDIRPIGVFLHEFCHNLGLPDLYDRTYNSHGIGYWGLMASGSWGGDGEHEEFPAHLCAWSKAFFGWLKVEEVNENKTITIEQVETSGKAYKIWEDPFHVSRYFLIENRQNVGFDRSLKGTGFLIYHVDENQWQGPSGQGICNDDKNHKLVDIEEADGLAGLDQKAYWSYNAAGIPFPGYANNRSFNNTSNPDSKDYDNQTTGIEINNISDSGTLMTADIIIRPQAGYGIQYSKDYNAQKDAFVYKDGAVLFKATERGTLAAIDLPICNYHSGPVDYRLKVYDGLDGSSPGKLLAQEMGTLIPGGGWHTIPISTKIDLEQGQPFFVSFWSGGFATRYQSTADNTGRSYISTDNGATYQNLNDYSPPGGEIRVRARVSVDKPSIFIHPQSIDFASVFLDSSSQREFSIYNTGNQSLVITSIQAVDTIAFFTATDSASIAAGDSLRVSVLFKPLMLKTYTDSLEILNNDRTIFLPLQGVGIYPVIFLSSTGNETFKDTTGAYDIWVQMNDVFSKPRVCLIYSEDGGNAYKDTLGCNLMEGGKHIASMPARPLGTVINYFFEAIIDRSAIRRLPADAPETAYTIKVASNKTGDLDGNWKVDVFDLLELLKQFAGTKPHDAYSDLNSDGKVDVFDLLKLLRILSNN